MGRDSNVESAGRALSSHLCFISFTSQYYTQFNGVCTSGGLYRVSGEYWFVSGSLAVGFTKNHQSQKSQPAKIFQSVLIFVVCVNMFFCILWSRLMYCIRTLFQVTVCGFVDTGVLAMSSVCISFLFPGTVCVACFVNLLAHHLLSCCCYHFQYIQSACMLRMSECSPMNSMHVCGCI